jgi:hypothetical protein
VCTIATRLTGRGVGATVQYTLLLFGGHIQVEHNSGGVTIDKWIQFAANGV